ncbi:MSC_0882 family membrane protein [Mycoplasma sp. E35C]|uniref:MSC_0882 family membrane protein n=1 Tax=Mycoplasma sp. E35C TaxID=2801918 RepID=UPI001CA3A652|nr:DUF981 family protein [Mycoplasma sp. E35C]QZX48992.1 hypothetical protein JJE79_02965 [Mycoplasma sp. E35C]
MNDKTQTLDLGIESDNDKYAEFARSKAVMLNQISNSFYNSSNVVTINQEEIQPELVETKETKMPTFYKKELFFSTIDLIFGIIVILLFGIAMLLIALNIYDKNQSWHIMWATIPLGLITLIIGYKTISNYVNIKSGLKNPEAFNRHQIAVNILRSYKSLKLVPININWLAAGIYIAVGLVSLVALVVAWGWNTSVDPQKVKEFGQLSVLKEDKVTLDYWPLYTIITTGGVGIGTLIIQIYLLITSSIRAREIETFYGRMPINDLDMSQIKSRTNKRNMIIFLIYILIIGLIFIIAKLIINTFLAKKDKKFKILPF